ncbi:MAG: cyclopropane-fatty-acyl-phospholipid synthase family protein [Calditrichia bacterium]
MKTFFKEIAGLMHEADPDTSFAIEFWDTDTIHFGEKPVFTLHLTSRNAARQMMANGFLGFGEAYMAQEVEVDGNLSELLRLGVTINFNQNRLSAFQKLRFLSIALVNRGTRRKSPKNISFHYDRGNDFYSLYLDESLTYSCAYFKNPDDTLEQAQANKYEHVCRKLQLKEGESLVDIGCGWGGMLIYAAQHYGITGEGCTLSRNQYEYANQKIKELALQERLRVYYRDYREMSGRFDKFVSIGMFEHVGKKYYQDFFKKTGRLLKKGGLGLLHSIGKDTPSPSDAWTMKYIFPGGFLPTLSEMAAGAGEAGFSVLDVENLRLHYARTVDCWLENYERNIEKVRAMCDESFLRRWRLFLASSAAGFRFSQTRLFQMLFSNGLNNELPMTREHIYRRKSDTVALQEY